MLDSRACKVKLEAFVFKSSGIVISVAIHWIQLPNLQQLVARISLAGLGFHYLSPGILWRLSQGDFIEPWRILLPAKGFIRTPVAIV